MYVSGLSASPLAVTRRIVPAKAAAIKKKIVRPAAPVRLVASVPARLKPFIVKAPVAKLAAPIVKRTVGIATGVSYPYISPAVVKPAAPISAGTRAALRSGFTVSRPFVAPARWQSQAAPTQEKKRVLPSGATPVSSFVSVSRGNVITPAALAIVPPRPTVPVYSVPPSVGTEFPSAPSSQASITLEKPKVVITGNKDAAKTIAGFSPVMMILLAGLAVGFIAKRKKA